MSFAQLFRNGEIDSNILAEAKNCFQEVLSDKEAGKLPVLELPSQPKNLEEFEPVASFFMQYETVVVLGTGGSSLGGQSLVSLNQDAYGFTRKGPRLLFLDNIDPDTFDRFLSRIVLEKTGFIVISKSGNTAETICQLETMLTAWKAQNILADPAEHFLVITEPKKSQISSLIREYELQTLDHHMHIGGRFAAFSVVGLLPAQIAGLKVSEVLKGAQSVLDQGESNTAIEGSAWIVQNYRAGLSQSVMMPYVDRLNVFCKWYRQLWAESLGKDGKGITPIAAYGTVDQHSQLQLYLDGPKDKMFSIIATDHRHKGLKIGQFSHDFKGKTMGDLMYAEQQATIETLIRKGCSTRVFNLEEINEFTMGALMMHFILETMITAKMLGVNAFDQPAVEEGKILAKQYLDKEKAA